jgi:hypothetical protein
MLIIDQELENIYRDLIKKSKETIRKEMDEVRDGFIMNYTGKLKDIGIDVEPTLKGVVIDFEFEPYGIKINEGYSAEDAQQRVQRIGVKKYYGELYSWVRKKKGLDGKAAKKAAYAILNKHLNEGYNSQRSGIGANIGFIDYLELQTFKMDEKDIATDQLFYSFIRQINALYSLDLYFI